jgi:TonB family protein
MKKRNWVPVISYTASVLFHAVLLFFVMFHMENSTAFAPPQAMQLVDIMAAPRPSPFAQAPAPQPPLSRAPEPVSEKTPPWAPAPAPPPAPREPPVEVLPSEIPPPVEAATEAPATEIDTLHQSEASIHAEAQVPVFEPNPIPVIDAPATPLLAQAEPEPVESVPIEVASLPVSGPVNSEQFVAEAETPPEDEAEEDENAETPPVAAPPQTELAETEAPAKTVANVSVEPAMTVDGLEQVPSTSPLLIAQVESLPQDLIERLKVPQEPVPPENPPENAEVPETDEQRPAHGPSSSGFNTGTPSNPDPEYSGAAASTSSIPNSGGRGILAVAPRFNQRLIHETLVYPALALRNRRQGKVFLELFIDETGLVRDVTVLREDPAGYGFGEAAVKAFIGLRGEPARDNYGKPIATPYRYPVTFALN